MPGFELRGDLGMTYMTGVMKRLGLLWTQLRNSIKWPVLIMTALAAIECGGNALAQDWLQWGGPGRNFISESKGLADSWPASGPRRLWDRTLGEGHSCILV